MKEMYGRPYGLAGILAQAAVDAVEKKLQSMCKITGEDAAYWSSRVTLELMELNSDFTQVIQRITITKSKDWNIPEANSVPPEGTFGV